MSEETCTIAMLGAGPAAIYGADKLASEGHDVVMLNRDIKPGGLAEFGIYPNKHRMKGGLRTVFRRILAKPNIHYFGNIEVGEDADITMDEVRSLGFDAVVVAVGAQGTRWLGLEGEDAEGVFHAKDFVYHFNKLPPFSQKEFAVGDDVCIVGFGNVALDIVHWLSCEEKVDTATIVYRRGPNERSCTARELKIVSGAMDVEQIRAEIDRIAPELDRVDQDPDEAFEDLTEYSDEPLETESPTKFRVAFLRSPERVVVDGDNRVEGLEVRHNELVPTSEGSRPGVEGTDETSVIDCDTVVFAIGDKIDPSLGLPLNPEWHGEYATVPEPWEAHPERPRYMVWDPEREEPLWDTFVVGWARKASDGLVGKAKQDSEQGCEEVLAFLDGEFPEGPDGGRSADAIIDQLAELLGGRDIDPVDFEDVQRLESVEEDIAEERDQKEFKFASNERMLEVIEESA